MNRNLRQWIVAVAAGAGATLALAQALPGTTTTPMNSDKALRQYDAAKAACSTQPKVERPQCLRNAKDDYDRALGVAGAGVGNPDIGSGLSGRAGSSSGHSMGPTNNRS